MPLTPEIGKEIYKKISIYYSNTLHKFQVLINSFCLIIEVTHSWNPPPPPPPFLKGGMDFLKIGQKGWIQIFFNKGWDSVIREGRGYKAFSISLKGIFKAY